MSPTLQTLVPTLELPAAQRLRIHGLSQDSQLCAPGFVFCALRGTRGHGLQFAADAVARGAVAILYDPEGAPQVDLPKGIVAAPVADLTHGVGKIAARFYGQPGEDLVLVGVTGTDGKTSVVNLCGQILNQCGIPTATIGTLGLDLGQGPQPGTHTTPEAITLQAHLAAARDAGCKVVAMEVSSHALALGRVAALRFDHVALTTLGRDHLDFHASVAEYHAAKRALLSWPGLRTAHINGDAALVRRAWEQADSSAAVHFYGGCDDARWILEAATPVPEGLDVSVCVGEHRESLRLPLYGAFNAGNALAAASLAEACGARPQDILAALPNLRTVPGRMQALHQAAQPTALVDYAHTPEALESALLALRAHRPLALACVFGCGGDRDRGKRPLMAAAAEKHADRLYITDDNPRSERPQDIVADMLAGLRKPRQARVEHDRATAIRLALSEASADDIVLIAGKGHEDYQIVGAQRLTLSDVGIVRGWLAERGA